MILLAEDQHHVKARIEVDSRAVVRVVKEGCPVRDSRQAPRHITTRREPASQRLPRKSPAGYWPGCKTSN